MWGLLGKRGCLVDPNDTPAAVDAHNFTGANKIRIYNKIYKISLYNCKV